MKNYYGNNIIDMQVLPSFENLFSANGYLSNESYMVFVENVHEAVIICSPINEDVPEYELPE